MATTEVQPTTTLGKQLEEERDNRQLTKEAWCETLGVAKPTYLSWLTRSVDVEFQNVQVIAAELDVTLEDVYGWIADDHAHNPRTVNQPKDSVEVGRLTPAAA